MKKLLVLLSALLFLMLNFSCSTIADSSPDEVVTAETVIVVDNTETAIGDILPQEEHTAEIEVEADHKETPFDESAETETEIVAEEVENAVPVEAVDKSYEEENPVTEGEEETFEEENTPAVTENGTEAEVESTEELPFQEVQTAIDNPPEAFVDGDKNEIMPPAEGDNRQAEKETVHEDIAFMEVAPSSSGRSGLEYFLLGLCILIFILIIVLLIIIIRKPEWYKKKDK